jgi:hypothetical protein
MYKKQWQSISCYPAIFAVAGEADTDQLGVFVQQPRELLKHIKMDLWLHEIFQE